MSGFRGVLQAFRACVRVYSGNAAVHYFVCAAVWKNWFRGMLGVRVQRVRVYGALKLKLWKTIGRSGVTKLSGSTEHLTESYTPHGGQRQFERKMGRSSGLETPGEPKLSTTEQERCAS